MYSVEVVRSTTRYNVVLPNQEPRLHVDTGSARVNVSSSRYT